MKVYYATEAAYKRGYAKGYEEGLRSGLDLRPRLADGKPATFHRWVEEATERLNMSACTLERNHTVSALVEYPDGSVGRVKPELIEFLDRKEG